MAAQQKIVLSASRDIPFNKLMLSQANVRRVKAGVSVEQLAEDIARRTLLQSLSVRPVLDADGNETGMFEAQAGGRRFRALELLVKQKRMARTQSVPCVVRTEGLPEDDSLAENSQREALHPLDQFRSFQLLRDKGLGEEEIAARHFVTPAVVKQRLKLAAVSPKLHDLYADDQLTLEQLMAFTVTNDHARQEQVWESLSKSYNKEPYYIKRLLTETVVRASDRRAQFVGVGAYEAAGGIVMRDLFQDDHGGWLQDPPLLDRLVAEKLKREAEALSIEGWKWIEVATDFPYGHTNGLRRLVGETVPMSEEEQASHDALKAEFAGLEAEYAEADELPDEVDARLGELETLLASFEDRPVTYDPYDIARAGVFVGLDADGELHIERGFVRPEDEPAAIDSASGSDSDERDAADAIGVGHGDADRGAHRAAIHVAGIAPPGGEAGDEDEGLRPLSDRLVTELTTHRTLGLRDALANDPDAAFLAVLHVLCLNAFYRHSSDTCVEINVKTTNFGVQAPGLKDTASAKAIESRHDSWTMQLPDDPGNLWNILLAFDVDSRAALFAHCASCAANAIHEPWNRSPSRRTHADQLARLVGLDMAAAGWTPTVENYLGRVSKARILEAVREAKGDASAQLIDHLKKPDMAREAERLLAGSGWLPEPLRTPDNAIEASGDGTADEGSAELPAFLAGEEQSDGSIDDVADAAPERLIAAE